MTHGASGLANVSCDVSGGVEGGKMTAAVRYVTSAIVVMSVAMASLNAAADWPLEGLYRATGVAADGAHYSALVQIIKFGDSYLVSWSFPHESIEALDDPDRIGVGIARGDVLAVCIFSEDFAGVVLYEIERDGRRLVGQWTGAGGDGVLRAETLTWLEASSGSGRRSSVIR